jgi:hypothetical protein
LTVSVAILSATSSVRFWKDIVVEAGYCRVRSSNLWRSLSACIG